MNRICKLVLILSAGVSFLTSCANSTKIIIPTYSAPREMNTISQIGNGGESAKGSFLALAINPEVIGDTSAINDQLDKLLISHIKQGLTETNFITIYPIFDDAYAQLNMQILRYDYKKSENDISADIQVSYTLIKGVTEHLTKSYHAQISRHSAQPHLLPSKSSVLSRLTQDVANKFISDITPLRSNQLREFKSLPSDISYVLTYAKQGNYQSAISDLEAYMGEKNSEFYYNLAVLYEAMGCKTSDVSSFAKASVLYRKAMQTGGHQDPVITKTKAKFDNFFRLFNSTEQQKNANKALTQELEQMFGI
ncbi:tetratricopeptide repeat protein [Catenovulum maritimum]|uniref:Lipoprotein n=1 Tax=Catenovulum maritimum TaxID=1513271 RepID=A0A0J8GR63_9ALTE|nr:hypothetical protein [Catenovulum maritimum]KMT65202.1 hypothetical protein XM47_10745 [Catenovulum maritimum]